ncbi:MAG: glutamine--fructose-6-phosphate transaminase (isomerizing) [Thermoplasmatota archaeon]
MCGIIGYTGYRKTQHVLLSCLKRLEYRGYDSAGISVNDTNDTLHSIKTVGEINALEKKLQSINYDSTFGIGHTRWATHGAVTEKNAHPHISCDHTIAIVHNGIIENFKTLRDKLEKKGHHFASNTDSEIFAHLIEEHYKTEKNLKKAVSNCLSEIKGSYALVAISKDQPETIVAARKDSPLVIGVGDNENFVASDIPAFLPYTKRVIYLDEGSITEINRSTIKVYDADGTEKQTKIKTISWDIQDAEKSGFDHYMLKEIYDQPESIHEALRGRISDFDYSISFPNNVETLLSQPFTSITLVACGTSYYAALLGKYLIESMTDLPVTVSYASEYRFFGKNNKDSLVIAITQSGETADTLAALKEAQKNGATTLAITNIIGSTITRLADGYLLMQSGPEIGVAATKTFTSQIMVLTLLSLYLSLRYDEIGADEFHHHLQQLKTISRNIRKIFDDIEPIKQVAKMLTNTESVFFIGRGIWYPLAREGALKLKEISYIHAEGFPAGELKHGPFALLTKKTPVIALTHQGQTYDKLIANIGEIKARGPSVIAIAEEDDTDIEKYVDYVLRYPTDTEMECLIPATVILQLLSYYTAFYRKCPIDKPRNLAKSVTVE